MATTIRVPVDLSHPRVSSLAGNAFWNVAALTDWDAGYWEFVKDVEGKVYGTVPVPKNLHAAAPAAAIVLYLGANAATGVTRMQVATAAAGDGETMNPAALADETAQDVAVPGTAYFLEVVTFDLTTDPAADELLIVEVFHDGDHANDTLAVNTILWRAFLQCDVS